MKNIFSNVASFLNKNFVSPLSDAVKSASLSFVKQAPDLKASMANAPVFAPSTPSGP